MVLVYKGQNSTTQVTVATDTLSSDYPRWFSDSDTFEKQKSPAAAHYLSCFIGYTIGITMQ